MSDYIFNPSDWNNTSEVTDEMISEIEAVLDDRYVDVVGDTMTGYFRVSSMGVSNSLNASQIVVNETLTFPDNSTQITAFTTGKDNALETIVEKTEYIDVIDSKTIIDSDLVVNKLIYADSTEQITAYIPDNSNTLKLTAVSYDSGQTTTTIANNCLINNLTCNNINTSHLVGTTNIVQTQLNTSSTNISTLLNKTRNIQSADSISTTLVKELRLRSSSTSINDSSITFNDSSIQTTAFTDAVNTLITNINSLIKYISSDNNYNATIAGTVATGNVITGGNITVVANLNANDILINNVSIKNRIVPVGCVQIYAGLSNNIPTGFLTCDGALVSKTTYASLFSVIADTYLYGRTANSTKFYLPDLQGMFVRGRGSNSVYTGVSGANGTGTYQTDSVQKHSHKYDKANNTINVVTDVGGSFGTTKSSVWDNSSDVMNTDSYIYDTDNTTVLINETRPHCISLNYIIKF